MFRSHNAIKVLEELWFSFEEEMCFKKNDAFPHNTGRLTNYWITRISSPVRFPKSQELTYAFLLVVTTFPTAHKPLEL